MPHELCEGQSQGPRPYAVRMCRLVVCYILKFLFQGNGYQFPKFMVSWGKTRFKRTLKDFKLSFTLRLATFYCILTMETQFLQLKCSICFSVICLFFGFFLEGGGINSI